MEQEILNEFDDFYEDFKNATKNIDDEPRGILRSEAFFVRSLCGHNPKRIIESGRARGQSTYLLAKSLPNTKIISIEYDKDSVDSQFALERLSECENVQCLFGDSRKLIPELVEDGDILLIDGPKDMDALLLINNILKCTNIYKVFIHDAYKGSKLRKWFSFFKPYCIYSDSPKFLQKYCHLDNHLMKVDLINCENNICFSTEKIYGGTFVCIDRNNLCFSISELLSIYFLRSYFKIIRSILKRLGLNYLDPQPCE